MFGKTDQPEIKLASGGNTSTIVGAFLIIVAIAGYVFFVRPLGEIVSTAQAEISAKDTEISTMKSRLDVYKKSEEDLNITTAVKKDEVLKAIPGRLKQDEVIEDLIKIADDYKVDLRSISFSKGASSTEGVSTLRISSSFEGNYSDLTAFLEGIEQNARLFKVDNISVQVKKVDVSDIERANFSLSIEAFYQDNK